MARTNLPCDVAVKDSAVTQTSTAIDATNGMNIQLPATPNQRGGRILLRITNSSGSNAITVTVDAGAAYPLGPAWRAQPLVLTVAVSATVWAGPFETAEVEQADQSINLDFTGTSPTGTISAVYVPTVG
jgi:hypothetical protein